MRAEIRAGELLREMKVRGERHKGDNKQNLRGSRAATPVAPKLSDLGINKSQSSRWQKLPAGFSRSSTTMKSSPKPCFTVPDCRACGAAGHANGQPVVDHLDAVEHVEAIVAHVVGAVVVGNTRTLVPL